MRTAMGKSIFTLRFPQDQKKDKPHPLHSNRKVKQVLSTRILVVEHEPSLLKTIQYILTPYHRVTVALEGRTALNLLGENANAYDIILSDLSVSNLNGIDLYRFLEKKYPGLEEHIIFMMYRAEMLLANQFLAEVSNLCVLKPFSKDELLNVVEILSLTLSH